MGVFTIIQNLSDGKTANFVDRYPYASYAAIKSTRLLLGNFKAINTPQTFSSGVEMDQWREYRSLTLTGYTYDNILIPFGGTFIPFITGVIIQSGSQMQTTGLFSQYTTFLPTANFTPYILTPAIFGMDPNDGVFEDMVYNCTYETYIDNSPGTPTNVVNGKQYMVYGSGATAVYNANTYREGEVFIASNNNTISFTGGGTVKILSDITFEYLSFTYNIQKGLSDIQAYMFRNNIQNPSITYQISVLYARLKGIQSATIQDFVSATVNQNIIEDLTSQIIGINNCLLENA